MKLSEFDRSGDKGHPRFVTRVQDVSGDETFELTIAGPEGLVREVLADATIELTIDSAQSEDHVKRRLDELRAEHRKQMWFRIAEVHRCRTHPTDHGWLASLCGMEEERRHARRSQALACAQHVLERGLEGNAQ